MPTRYKRKRSSKRRRPSRKRRKRRKRSKLGYLKRQVGMSGKANNRFIPAFKIVNMSWTEEHTFDPTAPDSFGVDQIPNREYNMNNPFDVCASTTLDHKAQGYAEAAEFYDQFLVIGSKAVIKVIPNKSANAATNCGALIYDAQQTPFTPVGTLVDFRKISENKNATSRLITHNEIRPVVFSKTYSNDKFWGVNWFNVLKEHERKHTQFSTGARFGVAPARTARLFFGASDVGGNDPSAITIDIKIYYTVLCFDPKHRLVDTNIDLE